MSAGSWVSASRPKTLLAILVPVLLGCAIAWHDGVFHPGRALLALLAGLFVQIGTNFFNDYADFKLGADTEARVGPQRAVASGAISPKAMLAGTFLVFGLALISAVVLSLSTGWEILVLGVVSVLCGFWYTAGRWSLAYLGLGEVFVMIFFGFVATGATYYVQAGNLPLHAWLSGIVPGALSTALIVVNNWRDIDGDRKAGKMTLAARFGPRFAFVEYLLCLIVGLGAPGMVLWWIGGFGIVPAVMFGLLFIPLGLLWATPLRAHLRGSEVAPLLGRTAFLLLFAGLLFSIGWIAL